MWTSANRPTNIQSTIYDFCSPNFVMKFITAVGIFLNGTIYINIFLGT
jgi:translation initiation factor 2B subunit (eIF-2B alpha/beta/delta family)